MVGIARLADRGPTAAALLAAALLSGGLLLPILLPVAGVLSLLSIVLGGAVVCYVLLRRGERAALRTLAICLTLMLAVSLGLYRSLVFVPLVQTLLWGPALIAALVLARTANMGAAIIAVLGLGMITTLIVSGMADETAAWRDAFVESLGELSAEGSPVLTAQQLEALTAGIGEVLPGMFGVSVMSIGTASLFIARYWQAALVNAGGFQREFHSLQLGRSAAAGCAIVVGLAALVGGPLWNGLAMVAIFAFFLQGLSVCHSVVHQRGLNRALLAGVYLLMLLPNTLLLLGALGLVDNVYRLRRI